MDVILVDWEETKSNPMFWNRKHSLPQLMRPTWKTICEGYHLKIVFFFEKRLNLDDKSNAIDCKIFDSILSGSANRLDW